jgi:hypothetical protein
MLCACMPDDRRPLAATILTVVLMIGCAAPLAITHLPARDLLSPSSSASVRVLTELSPQGWAFFSRSPREPITERHFLADGVWEPERTDSLRREFVFGLDRSPRARQYALESDLSLVDDVEWERCASALSPCLSQVPSRPVVDEASSCESGVRALVRRDPIPWAFRHEGDLRDLDVVKIDVRCPGED